MSSATEVSSQVAAGIAKLDEGGLVAFPTDTLYALGADATNDRAVERVFAVKGRQEGKPLPLFVSSVEMAEKIATLDAQARLLAGRFWPGALTLVLPKRPAFRSLALDGGDTVALRIPDHPIARGIVEGLGRPVTATSANLSGGPDPVTTAVVASQLGAAVDLIIEGGACPAGVSSTIVDCTGEPPAILREGAIAKGAIERVLAKGSS